ncbi:hypothetical protein WHZ77_06470 [Bradyrhizobium sp. A5]|uniref:hypothetical protein n=1 Tax=Bradyrhizobium sp. A5 TaxID=3133696 RepID=UPI00325506E2
MVIVRGFGRRQRIRQAPHDRIGEFSRELPFAPGRRLRKEFCGDPEARSASGGSFDVRGRRFDRQGHVQMDEGHCRSVFAEAVGKFRQPEPIAIDRREVDRVNAMILDRL